MLHLTAGFSSAGQGRQKKEPGGNRQRRRIPGGVSFAAPRPLRTVLGCLLLYRILWL
ncbi:MAG: hypothetical protein P8046_10130 [Anaerolineales bacterium]